MKIIIATIKSGILRGLCHAEALYEGIHEIK